MDIIWPKWPFKDFRDLYPKHPLSTGVFQINAHVRNELANPPSIPTTTPDQNDLAILWAHYPKSDPATPPWREIEADLIVGGISRADIKESTSKQLLLLLDRVHIAPPSRDIPAEMRKLWEMLEPIMDGWLNLGPPGELDASLANRDWRIELPYMDWSDGGGLRAGLDDTGAWCARCKQGADIPDEVTPYITTSFVIDCGVRVDKRYLPFDSPPLAEYQKFQQHKMHTKIYEQMKVCNELHERIADPDNVDPIPLEILRTKPQLAAWLNGENPDYRPTMAEYKVLWPAFIERRRRLREQSVRPDAAQSLPKGEQRQESNPEGGAANQTRADRATLKPKQLLALEIIENDGPILGKNLAKRITIEESTLRTHIIPALKPFGVARGSDGYHLPQRSAT